MFLGEVVLNLHLPFSPNTQDVRLVLEAGAGTIAGDIGDSFEETCGCLFGRLRALRASLPCSQGKIGLM